MVQCDALAKTGMLLTGRYWASLLLTLNGVTDMVLQRWEYCVGFFVKNLEA